MLLPEPPELPWLQVSCRGAAGGPGHDPSSLAFLREGGCYPTSDDTWPHPFSPQHDAVVLTRCRKAPVNDVSTPKCHSWDGVLGTVLILLPPPNTASGISTRKFYFGLI